MNISEIKKNITKENESNKKNNYIYVLKGIIISVVISIVCLLIYSLILAKSNIQENTIIPVVTIITSLSILIGSFISSINIKNKGIINGGIVGGTYIIVIYIFSSILSSNFSLNFYSFIMIAVAILAGMFGGILGVNIKKWLKKII